MSDTPSIPSQPDDPQPEPQGTAATADGVSVPAIVAAPEDEARERKIPLDVPIVSGSGREQVAAARARTPAEKAESAASDGRTDQASLLVMAPIRAGHYGALEELLAKVANPDDGYDFEVNCIIPFAQIRTLHFARILLHEASPSPDNPIPTYPPPPAKGVPQAHGPAIPPKLLFATDFDGPLDEHMDELLRVAGPGLDQVFSHCEGWPGIAEPAAVHGYFLRHRLASNTFYTGTMHRSVEQIHREEELHLAIEGWLDEHAEKPDFGTDPLALRERIRRYVFDENPDTAWARQEPGPYPRLLFNPDYLGKVAIGLVVAIFAVLALVVGLATGSWMTGLKVAGIAFGVVAVLLFAAWRFLRHLETTDPVIVLNKDISDLVSAEDRIVQNQMSSVIYIKEPLWFRGLVLRAVLAFIDFSAKYLSNQGTLAGIPSIHFARWVIVDGGRRLEFFSNFDGSWENYLGDFIDKSHSGLTGVWSNCVGFPRTKNLVQDGATDEQKFKAYSRDSQIPTQVWYSAYRWLSVDNINNNSKIRLGLYGTMTADEAALWLRRFGGSTNVDNNGAALEPRKKGEKPAPAPVVELGDVQGLVARSFNALKHADYLPVYLPADSIAARRWVGEMAGQVTAGDTRSDAVRQAGRATNLAFTADGLARLDIGDGMGTFPPEFREGMTTTHQRRVMGDDGPSAPETWAWGAPGHEVHAMIFLYTDTPERLREMVDAEQARAARHGVTLGAPLGSVMLDGDKEHFGFHDGIAQPRIAGFRAPDDGEAPSPTENVVPAGEVVMGYVNAYGQTPDSPTVRDTPRARAALPLAPRDPDAPPRTEPRRDLGRNGSYVVFRQLEQHVRAFWEYVDARARHDADERKKLAAKMVGRWPNGAPLVRHPETEPPEFDAKTANAFMYSGKWDDIRGDKCPLGSHIRRTNPRDGMAPGPAGSLLVADRHRLLRRGRAYGEPLAPSFNPADVLASDKPDTGRGLHFICFNTDLGRQFEFVQSTWVNNMKFDGLYRDADPLIGPHPDPADPETAPEEVTQMTEQRCPVRHRVHGVPRFVTTIGGAYLFMPGINALRYLAGED
jgi:Dyp-type peroxidase family